MRSVSLEHYDEIAHAKVEYGAEPVNPDPAHDSVVIGPGENHWTMPALRTTVPGVRISQLAIALFIAALPALGACGGGGARFNTQTASGFEPEPHTVSVLGVYKDGRMALGTWEKLAPHLVKAVAPGTCDVAFDELVTSNQELANAIDARARYEGPTGDLLAHFAPAARGDLVMVVSYSGRPPEPRVRDEPPMGAPVRNNMVTKRRRRNPGPTTPSNPRDRLDVSVSLYSVKQKRPVALVSMSYGSQDVEDALDRFGAELARTIPAAKCAGWNWDVKIDPEAVRAAPTH